jgi:hypothetical protein
MAIAADGPKAATPTPAVTPAPATDPVTFATFAASIFKSSSSSSNAILLILMVEIIFSNSFGLFAIEKINFSTSFRIATAFSFFS